MYYTHSGYWTSIFGKNCAYCIQIFMVHGFLTLLTAVTVYWHVRHHCLVCTVTLASHTAQFYVLFCFHATHHQSVQLHNRLASVFNSMPMTHSFILHCLLPIWTHSWHFCLTACLISITGSVIMVLLLVAELVWELDLWITECHQLQLVIITLSITLYTPWVIKRVPLCYQL